jgi:uncharacterized protein (TIGR03083 family)
VDHLEHCDALADEIDRFALALEAAHGHADVTSCPGWRVVDVAEHVGRIHRWAYELVRLRSPTRISPPELSITERDVTPSWIRDGGDKLVQLLRTADPDEPMWAWGVDQHVRYWSRRQLHETLVHRMDVELASGHDATASASVAVDAIDELLTNLRSAAAFSPGVVELRGDGERLSIDVSDTGAHWTISFHVDGFEVSTTAIAGDATIAGPASELLLTLYRRTALGASSVRVDGDERLAEFWLDHCALQ